MRLTNVAHLRLPFGRLLGYDVTVAGTGRELPVSFDQQLHVGAGDRAGSWMAIAFRLPRDVHRDALAAAWLAVVARHGTLRSVFSPGDDGRTRLHEVAVTPGGWVEHPVGPGQAVEDALRDVLDRTCRPSARPSHRLCVLETAAGPTVVLAADHAHVDMWSLLVVLRDLLAALAGAPAAPAAPAFAEHTAELRARTDVPDEVRARWSEVLSACGDVMPRFPLPLGAAAPGPERVEVRDVLDVDDSVSFSAQAREEGVSTLALAVAAMTEVTRELADAPLRAVFPVHSRHEERWHDSVGWFITNSVLESDDPSPAAAAAAVRQAIRLGSWPLEHVLAPWGGMPVAPGMFAISWLDLRRLPVRVDAATLQAQYVGAATRTDGVMLWFILDGSGMHLRCRYPDVPDARRSVGGWLDLLVERMQVRARRSVRRTLHVDGRTLRVERAERVDVPAVAALLSESGPPTLDDLRRQEAVFDVLARDRAHHLTVVRDDDDGVVATMQLTVVPGASRGGTTRLLVQGLRVAPEHRGRGVGTAMVHWAHEHGRAHGATLSEAVTGAHGGLTRTFARRLGYDTDLVGVQRPL